MTHEQGLTEVEKKTCQSPGWEESISWRRNSRSKGTKPGTGFICSRRARKTAFYTQHILGYFFLTDLLFKANSWGTKMNYLTKKID